MRGEVLVESRNNGEEVEMNEEFEKNKEVFGKNKEVFGMNEDESIENE